MKTLPTYLTTQEVAKLTGRAKQTLANDRSKCQGLPYYKLGASIRYLLSDVQDYMAAHRVVPGKRQ